jgi:type I restriction enzyme S subunit
MKDIQDGRVHIDPNVRVTLDDAGAEPYLLKDGDILLNRTNSPELVGKAGIYRGQERAVFASYLVRLVLDQTRADPDFVVQILASEWGQRNIRQLATRAISQANLNPTAFKNHFKVPLPTLREQIGIRNVLMVWDSAREKSEELIAAKGLMLHRLREGFLLKPKHSKRTKLHTVTRESTERNGTRFGRDVIMAVTKQAGMRPMREETIAASIERYKLVRPNGFAYNPMRLNIGSIAMSPFANDVLVSPDYVVFECDESRLLPGYLNHLRFSRHWTRYFDSAGNGSVRVRIYYDDLGAFAFNLPPLDEQRRIVQALDACALEIAKLAEYRDSLKTQKRGLMQKLLTGQWRIKVEEAEVPA